MSTDIASAVIDLWTNGRKIKKSSSGWLSANAVCCSYRGHSQDKRSRGGVIVTPDGAVRYSCFNCSFKTGYIPGNQFSYNFKKLLFWMGADEKLINDLSLQSLKARGSISFENSIRLTKINFDTKELPLDAVPLDPRNTDHQIHIDYLCGRGLNPDNYPYHVIEDSKRQGIIIPYFYEGKIVGHTTRYYDNKTPKYISDQPRGYIFNLDAQQDDWTVAILVEGQFDALSIGGCAYLGNNINDDQAQLLKRLNRTIIIVPDRDASGMKICDRALELGFKVSLPPWKDSVKDVNDAVKYYGKFQTLISILQHTTGNKIKVEMFRRKWK